MPTSRRLRRGIYLMPTLFTVGHLFCGYLSLVDSARGAFERAALLIIVAGILDFLDGRIARLTGSSSEFGMQFDSLADLVSFGIAPALLAYHWALNPLRRVGWLVAFLFVVCAAMRLARYNIQSGTAERRFFAGLPSPMAAVPLAALPFTFPEPPESAWLSVVLAVWVAALGLLMISRFRYRSFKDFDLRSRRSFIYVLPLAAMMVAISIHPKLAILIFSTAYLLSGPVGYLWGAVRRAGVPRVGRDETAATDGEVADEPAVR